MQHHDLHYVNHGSIVTMEPLSDAARQWIDENIPDDALRFGDSIAIEPRYFGEIAYGAQSDGLTSNVRVEPN